MTAAAGVEHLCARNSVRGTPREPRHCWGVLELYPGCTEKKLIITIAGAALVTDRPTILSAKSAHQKVFLESDGTH